MLRTSAEFAALTGAPSANASLLGIRYRTDAHLATPNIRAPRVRDEVILRVGIAAGRKVGGAVVRNRIRRRLKVVLRDLAPQLLSDAQLLIHVRAAAADATSAQLRSDLVACLRQARLVAGPRA